MIQQYNKNPLVAYSGTTVKPIVKVEYHLSDNQHSGTLHVLHVLCISMVTIHPQ